MDLVNVDLEGVVLLVADRLDECFGKNVIDSDSRGRKRFALSFTVLGQMAVDSDKNKLSEINPDPEKPEEVLNPEWNTIRRIVESKLEISTVEDDYPYRRSVSEIFENSQKVESPKQVVYPEFKTTYAGKPEIAAEQIEEKQEFYREGRKLVHEIAERRLDRVKDYYGNAPKNLVEDLLAYL